MHARMNHVNHTRCRAVAACLLTMTSCTATATTAGPPTTGAAISAGDRGAQQAHGVVLQRGAGSVSHDVLQAAIEHRVGIPELGPARVERSWRWNVGHGDPLLVWVTCRGGGDTRACAVTVGRAVDGNVQVLANEPAGWSVPVISETADRNELVVTGEDGRGTWRQTVRYRTHPEGGHETIAFSRRQYSDGI